MRCHKSERHSNASLKPRWEVDVSAPLQVEHIGIATVKHSKHKHCFEVKFKSQRKYILCADDHETMDEWLTTLTRSAIGSPVIGAGHGKSSSSFMGEGGGAGGEEKEDSAQKTASKSYRSASVVNPG